VLRLGLDALADESEERRARLEELDAMYSWWEQRLPGLREEYLAERKQAARSSSRTPKGRKQSR
jgi:hypothetical protein